MADHSLSDPGMAKVEAMLRTLEPDDLRPDAPPAHVWAGIEAQFADEPYTSGRSPAERDDGNVVPFRRRPSWGMPLMAAAAAVVLVVAGVTMLGPDASTTTLAAADLAFDPVAFDPAGAGATATAELVDDDGDQVIVIDDDSLPFDLDEDAALELWLIQADGNGNVVDLVSLGDIDVDGDRSFAVPAGYDADVYDVVDISVEPRDGDADHSGRSILRGQLTV